MTRSATIRTTLDEAEIVAASVRPDNTAEIDTRVERGGERDADDIGTSVERDADGIGTVVTTIERETTGSLRTTVDDYVVNLGVAQTVVQTAKRRADATTAVARADADDANHTDQTQS